MTPRNYPKAPFSGIIGPRNYPIPPIGGSEEFGEVPWVVETTMKGDPDFRKDWR